MKKYLLCIGVLSTMLCLTACNTGTSVNEKTSESKVSDAPEEVVDETVYFDDVRHWKLKADGTKYEVSVHKWDDGTTEKEATDDEDGLIVYVCSDCDAEKEEVIPKLKQEQTTETTTTAPTVNNTTTTTTTTHTHNITDVAFESDDVFHWKTCSCGEKIDKTKHTWISNIIEDATESKTGIKRHTCAVCGKTQDETIPKKTHTCSANETEYEHSNSYHWQVCKCGNKINQEKHKWNSGVVNITPTETTETFTCTTCGCTKTETKETEVPSDSVTPNEPVVPSEPNKENDTTVESDSTSEETTE